VSSELKRYRKREQSDIQAIQFVGGEDSAKKVNEILEAITGLHVHWKSAKESRRNSFGVVEQGHDEHLVLHVGDQHTMSVDVGSYLHFEKDGTFSILEEDLFDLKYEEVV
jgi:hypothetical protein